MKKLEFLSIFIPFLFFSFFYLLSVPIGQSPDEPGHIAYVEYLSEHYSLPTYQQAETAHHPPLYYLALLPAYLVFPNYYFLRFISLIFSLLNIYIIWKWPLLLFGKNRILAWGIAAFCAFLPMFVFMSSSVNNDSLSNLMGSSLVYFAVLSIKKQLNHREIWTWTLVVIISLLTKIVLWPIIFLTIILNFIKQRGGRKHVAMALGLIIAGILAWFCHNVNNYGYFDVLGWQELKKVDYILVETNFIRERPKDWLFTFFNSFWGVFGWFSIYFPPFIYSTLRIITVILIAPFILFVRRQWKGSVSDEKKILIFLGIILATIFSAIVKDNLTFLHPQGRYIFSVISITAVYYVGSTYETLKIICSKLNINAEKLFAIILILPMIFLNLLGLWVVVNYFYPG